VHVLSSRPALAGFPTRVALRGRHVTESTHRLQQHARGIVGARRRHLDRLRRTVESFDLGRQMGAIRTRLATVDGRLQAAIGRRCDRAGGRLRERIGRLESLSPLAVLSRGYAVAWNADRTRALRAATEVSDGENIRVTLAEGELDCEVRGRRERATPLDGRDTIDEDHD
jgi:exodeoxyribonuclease VII large subunit